MRFVIIHVWPDDLDPTIMPNQFTSLKVARKWADNFAVMENKPGHQYIATLLPDLGIARKK